MSMPMSMPMSMSIGGIDALRGMMMMIGRNLVKSPFLQRQGAPALLLSDIHGAVTMVGVRVGVRMGVYMRERMSMSMSMTMGGLLIG